MRSSVAPARLSTQGETRDDDARTAALGSPARATSGGRRAARSHQRRTRRRPPHSRAARRLGRPRQHSDRRCGHPDGLGGGNEGGTATGDHDLSTTGDKL